MLVAVVEEQSAADRDAKNAQERIDQVDDETEKLLGEYRQLKTETESFDAYSAQLATQIKSQAEEIERTNAELAEIETTTREVLPLMQNMLDTLARFVDLDVPFLLDERSKRVARLKEMMTRADVSVSEKYRRIVEAYVVEMEYGRTIEAYEDKLGGGDDRTVQLLRIGRVSLLYQTMDGKETGYWDADKKAWVVNNDYAARLPGRHARGQEARGARHPDRSDSGAEGGQLVIGRFGLVMWIAFLTLIWRRTVRARRREPGRAAPGDARLRARGRRRRTPGARRSSSPSATSRPRCSRRRSARGTPRPRAARASPASSTATR